VLRRLILVLLVTTAGCSSGHSGAPRNGPAPTPTTFPGAAIHLNSPAFPIGGAIPAQYTCDGAGLSPPLSWTGVPGGVASLALRVQDIDTPQKFIHWVVYDIPASTTSLAAGQVPPGAKQTSNSFGKQGYGGPCPPAGTKHRYVFTLLAMSTALNVSENVNPSDLWATLERSAVTGKGELTGTYQRAG
jgi:hypothetical protein